jgi:hypothetical protein
MCECAFRFVVQLMFCTECGLNTDLVRQWRGLVDAGKPALFEKMVQDYNTNSYQKRIKDVAQLDENDQKPLSTPWFLKCNMARYPAWEWKPDSRLY